MSSRTTATTGRNSAYDSKDNSPYPRMTTTTVVATSTIVSTVATSTEYVNQGFDRWKKIREEWRTRTKAIPQRGRPELRQDDVEEILERIFNAKDGNMVLPEPVPLGKMVDILQDVWESEGLYD
jgi:hypothetical protein